MLLKYYDNKDYSRGRSLVVEGAWIVIQAILFNSFIPASKLRVFLLRLFGAKVGEGVVIKPNVRIKFPWLLSVGDYSWIGEDVWIDNLAYVGIGSNCCISQGVYICTGSHDWCANTFDLKVKPVVVSDKAWICAQSKLSPGIRVGEGAVLSMGSVATQDLLAWNIYSGAPAVIVKKRVIQDA